MSTTDAKKSNSVSKKASLVTNDVAEPPKDVTNRLEKVSRPSHLSSTPDTTHRKKKVSSRRATTTTTKTMNEDKTTFPDSDTEPSDISTGSSSSSSSEIASDRIPLEMQSSEYRVSSTSTEFPVAPLDDTSTPTNDVKPEEKTAKNSPEEVESKAKTLESSQSIDSTNSRTSIFSPVEDSGTNLIVNYLPQNMTQEEIKSLFASIGEVESCKLIRDKSTSQNLGYGFVNYVSAKDAERAITTLNGLRLQNKTIKVSLARPSSESIKGANLYISGLPKSYTQQEMEKLFSCCGKIITSRILYDNNTGLSRGVGFIRFDQRSEAEYAIRHLNGVIPPGFTDPITVKLANSPSGGGNCNSGVSSTASGLISPTLMHSNYHYQHQGILLAAAAAAAAAAVAAGSNEVKNAAPNPPQPPPPPPPSAHSTPPLAAMAFMHQMGPLPANFTLTAHPVMPAVGHSSLHIANPFQNSNDLLCRPAPPVPTSRHLLAATAMTAIHMPTPGSAHEEPIISLPLMPAPGAQPIHHISTPTSAAAAATSGVLATPINARFSGGPILCPRPQTSAVYALLPRYPMGAPMSHDLSTALTTLSYMSPGVHTTPLLAATSAPPLSSIDPALIRHSGSGSWCLFVHNLAPDTEEATLWRLFGPFGAVRSVSVVREHGPGSKCRGFGFVNMTNYDEAVHAIQHLNGYALGNRILQVTFKSLNYNPKAPAAVPTSGKLTKS